MTFTTTRLYEWMRDDMDFDAGRMMAGMALERCGEELVQLVAQVANGQQT